jgi:hypothetical protein
VSDAIAPLSLRKAEGVDGKNLTPGRLEFLDLIKRWLGVFHTGGIGVDEFAFHAGAF